MESYGTKEITLFLEDPVFREWVIASNPALDEYWAKWMKDHPMQADAAMVAAEVIRGLHEETDSLSEQRSNRNIADILTATVRQSKPEKRSFLYKSMAAASVILLAVFVMYQTGRLSLFSPEGHDQLAGKKAVQWVEKVNPGAGRRTVSLPDGSTVILLANSSLRYPEQFDSLVRRVQLKGEAFFEINRDASWPFEVKTKRLSTRVLGTSFRVRDFENDNSPWVRVKTGKVEVRLLDERRKDENREAAPVFVTSNEQVSFRGGEGALQVPTVSSIPDATDALPIETKSYRYKGDPVSSVIHDLELSYDIKIEFDQDRLKDCSLTATLGDEPLAEKLRMICLGLNLQHQFKTENTVELFGVGCK